MDDRSYDKTVKNGNETNSNPEKLEGLEKEVQSHPSKDKGILHIEVLYKKCQHNRLSRLTLNSIGTYYDA